jgi:hypothetical protein
VNGAVLDLHAEPMTPQQAAEAYKNSLIKAGQFNDD